MKTRKITKAYLIIIGAIYILISTSCKKYLEAKPDQKLAIASTLTELQGLLDNYSVLNQTLGGTAEASSDNYYLERSDWESHGYEHEKRIYTWENDHLFADDGSLNEWFCNYRAIYYTNSILTSLSTIPRNENNKVKWDYIRGQALFFRAQYFLRTALLWSPAFDEQTAQQDLGIPLRLSDNFNTTSVRASVAETYKQILKDLEQSVFLLPQKSSHPAHPSKPSSYALLARTNLAMRRYLQAGLYADSCLQIHNGLIDFNKLNSEVPFPISQFNEEVILWNRILAPVLLGNTIAKIDPKLYTSYTEDDLRKKIFFMTNTDGSIAFKGYYEQLTAPFGGIATDEVVLMKAECEARAGNTNLAMQTLNRLIENRIKKQSFIPLSASNSEQALMIILDERRKELLMRDLRWMDLKRLNKEGANISITRILGDRTYILKPNDLRYALPIPETVISLSGMPQNRR